MQLLPLRGGGGTPSSSRTSSPTSAPVLTSSPFGVRILLEEGRRRIFLEKDKSTKRATKRGCTQAIGLKIDKTKPKKKKRKSQSSSIKSSLGNVRSAGYKEEPTCLLGCKMTHSLHNIPDYLVVLNCELGYNSKGTRFA
ncbi:hypothetical protein VNO77_03609 [Canavalia gladiata]|uniref:Uncharacterized protein n=1 Tax=Canavalia gladiata TaxID=3824 RepID=A0AAN9MUZ3_CANGL